MYGELKISLPLWRNHPFGESRNRVTHIPMFDQAAMVTVCQPVKIDLRHDIRKACDISPVSTRDSKSTPFTD